MIKKIFSIITVAAILSGFLGVKSAQAAGISPSGGGTYVVGQNFTVYVRASGTTFDSLQGTINVSGPVKIVSFYASSSATWLPGKSPANGRQFVGLVSATSSITVATITLRGTSTGSGSVTVSGARLAYNGSEVSSNGGSTYYTINRAPTPPGQVSVTSSTHPDQKQAYEATNVTLNWEPPANGATGYSIVFDQAATTNPEKKVSTTKKTETYKNVAVGTHYFHIRAENRDGWSPTTHFKVTIKETVDNGLGAPTIEAIELTDDYTNDINEGKLTGVKFRGTGIASYTMLLTFDPLLGLDAKKYPDPVVDEAGKWEFVVNEPLKVGFYKLTAQGKLKDTLTPSSETITFEISVSEGGSAKMLSSTDEKELFLAAQAEEFKAAQAEQKRRDQITWGSVVIAIISLLTGAFIVYFKGKKFKKHLAKINVEPNKINKVIN
ncbi:fibronectin type III domain-containing protein [Candidatus Berkelbacteria bacterium]|nr:fibronectin type III domain-containing protein [Candidatus Berkelbacteria bacterium]